MKSIVEISKNFANMSSSGKIVLQPPNGEIADRIWFEFKGLPPCVLEDMESEFEKIAFQIREFRMKNFPENTEIEDIC